MTDWIVIGVICLILYLAACIVTAKLLKRRFRPADAFEAEMAETAAANVNSGAPWGVRR